MLQIVWQYIEVLRDWESPIGKNIILLNRIHCMHKHLDYIFMQKSYFCFISSHIILMLADDMACNARNPRPGKKKLNSIST